MKALKMKLFFNYRKFNKDGLYLDSEHVAVIVDIPRTALPSTKDVLPELIGAGWSIEDEEVNMDIATPCPNFNDLIAGIQEAINALNQIPNKRLKGNFKDSYAVVSHLSFLVATSTDKGVKP